MTPRNRACGPSSRSSAMRVPMVVGGFGLPCTALAPLPSTTSSCEAASNSLRVVMRVLTTQMGFVRITVADPARAPAIMDSAVVSFLDVRPALAAAFSKKARVHSYQ